MKNSQARRRKYSQRKFLEAPEEVKELVRKAAPRFVVVDGGPPLDDRALISRSKARQLRGNVSAMTWWRWEHNASLNMPKAEAINGRYYYRLGEILNWSPLALQGSSVARQPAEDDLVALGAESFTDRAQSGGGQWPLLLPPWRDSQLESPTRKHRLVRKKTDSRAAVTNLSRPQRSASKEQ
jgi:hypothetical protein